MAIAVFGTSSSRIKDPITIKSDQLPDNETLLLLLIHLNWSQNKLHIHSIVSSLIDALMKNEKQQQQREAYLTIY